MTKPLTGQLALVTGASRGIGAAPFSRTTPPIQTIAATSASAPPTIARPSGRPGCASSAGALATASTTTLSP